MSEFTVRAARLSDGRELELPMTGLRIAASLESPAKSLWGRFALESWVGELGRVSAMYGHRPLFEGQVDRQRTVRSGEGTVLELEARSKGAMLLDNEAMPCALANVRLSTVFGLFAAPYGFVLYNPNHQGMLASYTVRKGVSEWEALAGYVRRVFGLSPYVEGEQVVVDRPRQTRLLKLGEGGHPFSRLEQVHTPYRMLSKVILRDGEGRYSAGMSNPDAGYYGVRRKRYVIPATEFVDNPALDARQRIGRSMLEAWEVGVTLPGVVDARIGQEVVVSERGITLGNLLVRDLEYREDERGYVTELRLVSTVYHV